MHVGEMCTYHTSHTHSPHTSRDAPCVFGSMACCFFAKLVLGPPHYHDTFQTCQTWRVGVCMLARCARTTRRTRTHHTRVEMHLVCLGVWRVVFLPSWCSVHHTTMTPFKRARRGEWAYACWRDVHVPHVAHALTTHESRCTLCVWEYGVLFFC